jgi:hypothetical protein
MDVSTLTEFLFMLAFAIALAAFAGLRVWLPLFFVVGLARLGVLDFGPSFEFLASTKALVLFGVATAIELVNDKIPAVDHPRRPRRTTAARRSPRGLHHRHRDPSPRSSSARSGRRPSCPRREGGVRAASQVTESPARC